MFTDKLIYQRENDHAGIPKYMYIYMPHSQKVKDWSLIRGTGSIHNVTGWDKLYPYKKKGGGEGAA